MKKLSYIIIFLLITINNGYPQKTLDYKKAFMTAESYFMYERYSDALNLYLELIKNNESNMNLYYRTGLCYLNNPENRQVKKAIRYFNLATEKKLTNKYSEGSYREKRAPRDLYFYLGNAYSLINQFDSAIICYEKYRDLLSTKEGDLIDQINRQIETVNNAKELIKTPQNYELANLEDYIKFPDAIKNYPIISGDENTIIYIPDIKKVRINSDNSKIYYSQYIDNQWIRSSDITFELRADKRTIPVCLSPDGKTLLLVKDDFDDGNIYSSTYSNGKWAVMKKLNGNINTKSWESYASLSKDGKTLYFASARQGGFGGLDIYKSELNDRGDWGEAVNLGPTINTKYNEDMPTILDDGKTLYFCSNGNYSMGGFDLFVSTKLGDNDWSAPQNVGVPVNTVENDLYCIVKSKSKYLFFPVDKFESVMGENNVYKNKEVTPKIDTSLFVISGSVLLQDNMNELPNDFKIFVIDTIKSDTISIIQPDIFTGKYSKKVTSGNYKLVYKGNGYITQTQRVFIPQDYDRKSIVVNVDMTSKDVGSGQYFVIKSIFFDYNKYDIRLDAKIEIEKFLKLMKTYNTLQAEIIGFTDSKGSKEGNKILADKRASSIAKYLTSNGINANRILTKGIPQDGYIAINENPDGTDNPEGRQYNRRVEIRIVNSLEKIVIKQENIVPENLKYSRFSKNDRYMILLAKQKNKINDLKDLIYSENKAGEEYIYTSGDFSSKPEAINLLNHAIDLGFSEAKIISDTEYDEFFTDSINTSNNTNIDDNIYTIQISAFTKSAEKGYLKNLDGVKEHICSDGFYKYTYKQFNSMDSAKAECNKIRDLGYKDAFVINLNRINQISRINQSSNDEVIYTIQLCSLKRPVDLKIFKNLTVIEHITPDGSYKYTYGTFNKIANAKKELKKLADLGFPDAFVVKLGNFSDK